MPIQSMPPTMPRDIEAEEAVLGALLIDPQAISRVSWLKASDFYQVHHGMIFEAIAALHARGQVADFVTLVGELERTSKLAEVGNASGLSAMVNAAPTAANIVSYARRVEHCAACRGLIRAAGTIAQLGYAQPVNIDMALSDAEKALFDLRKGRQSTKIITPSDRAQLAMKRYEHRQEGGAAGIPYGLLALDQFTQGAEHGQLVIVAGRPGQGKTSLLQYLAENMSRQSRKTVLFATCEMPDAQLVDRSVSGRVQVSLHVLQRGQWGADTWAETVRALSEIADEPLYSYDDADMTTATLRSAAIEMRSRYGLDAVYVDYLQLLNDQSRGNEVDRVTGISRSLKALARALNVPVIVASQLSRAVEGRDNKRPQLSDLRASGSIEQDADIVVFIMRPGLYDRSSADNIAEITIAKQRNGPAGITNKVRWNGALTRFEDSEERYQYTG